MSRSTLQAALALLLGAASAALASGCTTESFCFNCEGPSGQGGKAGSGGSSAQGGSAGAAGSISFSGSGGSAGGGECIPGETTQTDPKNCGQCGKVCSIPGGFAKCVEGECALDTCATGFYDQNGDPADGCEYACTPSNGGVEICDTVDNDCNGTVDDNVDTSKDVNHCGACNSPCILTNAVPACEGGKCVISECLPGATDKDGDPATGCEYGCGITNGGKEVCDGKDNDCNGQVDDNPDTTADPLNCGACGTSCEGKFANTEPKCEASACVLGPCLTNFFDKDNDPSNGCEFNCTLTCSPPFAEPKCDDQGNCAISQCQPGYYDLNGDVADGCEYACNVTNGGVELCDLADNDCNGTVDDPDKVDTTSDPKNCGACGTSCAGKFANATALCEASTCKLGACQQGYLDKDGDPSNGCEYSCEALCSFPFAVPKCDATGACSMGDCLLGYYDLNKDPKDGCEYACTPSNGGVEICDKKDNDCNGTVDDPDKVDTSTDPFNCGACGTSCAGTFPNAEPKCDAGKCVLGPCLTGYTDVDKKAANGCEYNCQASCSFPFATGVCGAGGTCTFGQCLIGHYDLNKDPKDGCEYACAPTGNELCDGKDNNCDGQVDEGFDFNSDPLNCGGCGKRCDVLFPNANAACKLQAGKATCVFDGCKPGFNNDDGNTANGCEYACAPSNGGVEICDGKDNDCDGLIDNPPGGVFNPALPDKCTAADSLGECEAKTVCQNGQPTCVQTKGPSPEICDGKDNNCDGTADNGSMPQIGVPCGTSQVGECKFGTTICQAGGIVCDKKVDPKPETCDGKDNNCDGIVDNNPTDAGGACGSSTGACKPGVQQCVSGALQCVGSVAATAEVCDGPVGTSAAQYDNNCDGSVNEGCTFPRAGITRLDTLNSTQGQFSSFQLSTASANSDFLAVYADNRSGAVDIYGRASSDAGNSWGTNDFLISGAGNSEVEPYVFLRPGRAYVVFSRFEGKIRRIHLTAASAPYTAGWSASAQIDPNATNNTAIDCYGPQGIVAKAGAAANQDIIAVLWSEIAGTQANPTRNIFLKYSKDGGASFSAVVPINTGTGKDKGELPVIASNGSGVVYVAWRDKRIAGLAQAYVGRLDLSGSPTTLSNVTVLQPTAVATGASAEQIVLAADQNNNVHVGFVDLRPPKKTIRVASSNDAGVTWSNTNNSSGIINLDSTFADANAPSLAAQGGRVVAAWEDTRSGAEDIRVNFSTDAGKTWQPTSARADTGDGLGATSSLTPRIAFGQNDNVFVTWQDLRFPSSAILANVSIDLGKNFYADAGSAFRMDINNGATGAGADSQFPAVLGSPLVNRAAVIWIDFRNAAGNNGANGDIWTRTLE